MKVLVACEYSGKVRDSFIRRGHDAMSCDLLPTEVPGPHYQGDVFDIIGDGWDLMLAFPPCTDVCSSGARWFKEKRADGRQQRAIQFVRDLMNAPIDRIAIENPIGVLSSEIRKPDQIIQPWMFGHYETKATCLWLKGLHLLDLTYRTIHECREALGLHPDAKPEQRIHRMPPGPDRWKERSRTYQWIAEAFANQWGR